MDFNKYAQQPNNYHWVEIEDQRLGEAGRRKMMNDIYNVLLRVPPGKFFDIANNVKSENQDLFVKTSCEFIDFYPNYRFNRTLTIIHHDHPWIGPKTLPNEIKEVDTPG